MNYEEKIENSELFIRCLYTVEDAEGICMREGKEYEVIGNYDDCWLVRTEDVDGFLSETLVQKDDDDIELVIY